MRIPITLASLAIAGCASIQVTPPEQRNFNNSATFPLPFDTMWLRSVDWFADHNVAIDKIEKSSGLLTAKYQIRDSSNFLDCGDIKLSGTMGKTTFKKYGTLNITVRPRSDDQAKVAVNFFGEFEIHAQDAGSGDRVSYDGPCISTGVVEKSILREIGS